MYGLSYEYSTVWNTIFKDSSNRPELWIVPGKVAHGVEGESKFVNSFSTELYANIVICNLNIASYT